MANVNDEHWFLVATLLSKIVANIETAGIYHTSSSRFESIEAPNITISEYLARIHKYLKCSDSCYILAFIYIDRAVHNNPDFILSMLNIHRLILTAIVLAIKYLDDIYANNFVYSKIGGISAAEFNELEIDMLKMMNFDLYVSSEVYFQFTDELQYQALIINEEKMQEQEEMEDFNAGKIKPLRQIISTESIETNAGQNEMFD